MAALRLPPLPQVAAHAFGSFAGLQRVGATGALTCFSFDAVKSLTCGDGGAIVPRTPEEATALHGVEQVALVDLDVDHTVPFNCVVRVPAAVRDEVHSRLRADGVAVGVHYPLNHQQPAFAQCSSLCRSPRPSERRSSACRSTRTRSEARTMEHGRLLISHTLPGSIRSRPVRRTPPSR